GADIVVGADLLPGQQAPRRPEALSRGVKEAAARPGVRRGHAAGDVRPRVRLPGCRAAEPGRSDEAGEIGQRMARLSHATALGRPGAGRGTGEGAGRVEGQALPQTAERSGPEALTGATL